MRTVLVVVLLSMFPREHILTCDFDYRYLLTTNKFLDGQQLWRSQTKDASECAISCIRRKLCASFNFDSMQGLCELNRNSSVVIGEKDGGSYSYISDWPSQIDPDCYSRPCDEDEICVPSYLGSTSGSGSTCSYACLKLNVQCSLPEGVQSSQSRSVGSTFIFTCDSGYIGGDTAVCLTSGYWNKTIDTTCTPVFGSGCTDNANCSVIDGICMDSKCTCPQTLVYNETQAKCISGCGDWLEFGQHCYLLGSTTINHAGAESFCENQDATLVQVDTRDELNFLKNKMQAGNQFAYWNDLYQFGGTERWKASNESLDPQVSDWATGEPNRDWELCTVFIQNEYQWADMSCDIPAAPACEKQNIALYSNP